MKKNKGFTLLIAIITTSMLLIVSFVVVNVALKQLVLANTAKESQYAFYAADSGTECAVYWDLHDSSRSEFATSTPGGGTIICNGQSPISTNTQTIPIPGQSVLSLIGGGGTTNPTSIFWLDFTRAFSKGCAIVRVTKENDGKTTIDSRGYNTCDTSALRRYERGVRLTY
jgi:type II secretory pathway pseudopilin PulG